MGAHDYIVTIRETDQSKVKEQWEQIVDNDRYESGSGAYAGNATTMHGRIKFYDRRLASAREAREFCLDKHEKWSGPVAVSFYLPAEPTASDEKRKQKAQERFVALEQKRLDSMNKILEAFLNRKSKLVACKCCESRLSLKHLSNFRKGRIQWNGGYGSQPKTYGWTEEPTFPACPLCKASLLSETDLKRIEALSKKNKDAKVAYSKAMEPKASKQIAWAVGGWAAS